MDQETSSTAISDFTEGLRLAEVAELIHGWVNFPLFSLGGTDITPLTVLLVGVMIVATWWISHFFQRALDRTLFTKGVSDPGTAAVTKRLLHYAVMALGLGLAIQQVGINLSALFAAGAIFAVGIGFAMQNIAQNFVSGIILMVERAITPGDIVEVEGRVVRILKMGIRTTIARTRDDEEIIIPNASLVQTAVKNFTLDDPTYRIRASVGVHYNSDMNSVRNALEKAARGMEGRLEGRDPVILLLDFGDSSVDWEVSVWCDDPWLAPRMASSLRERIWWGFKESGVEISYPQMDVHFDPPVEQALQALPRAS